MRPNLGRQTFLTEGLFLLSPSMQIPRYRLPLIGHGFFYSASSWLRERVSMLRYMHNACLVWDYEITSAFYERRRLTTRGMWPLRSPDLNPCIIIWEGALKSRGTAVAQWLRCCVKNRKVAGSIPDGAIDIFHWHKILPIALWSWGRLSLWKKWVPGAFPGGKGGRCVGLTLPPPCAFVM